MLTRWKKHESTRAVSVKEQLKNLETTDANPNIGIAVSWMHDGDRIAEFDNAKWE